jgi:hypothetical protein
MSGLEMEEMAGNSGSKDKSLEALDFIINVLKEHEQNLDKSIAEFAEVTEHMGNTDVLNGRIENVEKKLGTLQKEITSLIGILSNSPKEKMSFVAKKLDLPTEATCVASVAPVQGGPSVTLHCKQWRDFQSLALKGNQLILFSGALPNFGVILKTWLSRQLGVEEGNILEGSIDTYK